MDITERKDEEYYTENEIIENLIKERNDTIKLLEKSSREYMQKAEDEIDRRSKIAIESHKREIFNWSIWEFIRGRKEFKRNN